MALDETRLIDALQSALLLLPARNPSVTDPADSDYWTTIGELIPDPSIFRTMSRKYFEIIVDEFIKEIKEHAKISIKMTEHTHTLTLVPVSGGGYTVTGTTDIPNGAIEIGNPENTPISTGGIE